MAAHHFFRRRLADRTHCSTAALSTVPLLHDRITPHRGKWQCAREVAVAREKERWIVMNGFRMLKIWMPLVGLGAVLALAPSSGAQAEVAPDHFDGTDSWAAAATSRAPAIKAKQPVASSALRASGQRPSTQATPQVVSAKNVSNVSGVSEVQRPEALTVPDKRKTPSRKLNDR